jgi:hypothetical protein
MIRSRGGLGAARGPLAALLFAHGVGRWGGKAEYDPVRRIESARVYGNIDVYAYYYVDLEVGRPAQRVSVIVDTGSELAAFPCKGCSHCGQHIDPAFDMRESRTASWIGCDGWCRGSCKEAKCCYYQGYMEGSSISGWWFEDEVRIGDNFSQNPPVRSKMGCHTSENKLFYDQRANGILGIGPSSRTLLQDLFADQGHVDSSIFALCFADWGGRLVVGGHNESYHTGPVQYMPMTTSSGQYIVPLAAMLVDGLEVSNMLGTTFIDSGTTYTYMATSAYRALRDAIEKYCSRNGNCGARQTGKCWSLSEGLLPQSFPNVTMVFESFETTIQMTWGPRSYMYQRGAAPDWCYSFEDDGPGAGTTLGASWMVHQEVIFDMRAMKVGIAPAACPEFRREVEGTIVNSASSKLASAVSRLGTGHRAIWWAAAAAMASMSLLACAASRDIFMACPTGEPVEEQMLIQSGGQPARPKVAQVEMPRQKTPHRQRQAKG